MPLLSEERSRSLPHPPESKSAVAEAKSVFWFEVAHPSVGFLSILSDLNNQDNFPLISTDCTVGLFLLRFQKRNFIATLEKGLGARKSKGRASKMHLHPPMLREI